MRILFLDVDGVLNSALDRFSFSISTDKHLDILRTIISITGAKIVVSSAWRLSTPGREVLCQRLNDFGMEVYGYTPISRECGVPRGKEIMQFLEKEKEPVESFAIVDDEADMLELKYTNLVQTDPWIGLTESDAKKIIEILNGD